MARVRLALLLVCSVHFAGASCRPALQHHRLLLQAVPPPCRSEETGCSNQSDARVVEVDLIDKECVIMKNTWFDGPAAKEGAQASNFSLEDSPLDCCKACFEQPRCSVWTYCEQAGGCSLPGDFPQGLPFKGCRLVALPNFHPLANRSMAFPGMVGTVPFLSGAPVELTLPKVPNYQINAGVDLNSQYDYKCEESPRSDVCEVAGDAYALARLCDEHPECLGFVYLPKGLDFCSSPIGILKGGQGVPRIPLSAVAVNPSTAIFLKNSTVYNPSTPAAATTGNGGSTDTGNSGSGGGGSSHTVLYIVLPVSLAIAMVATAGLALFAVRLRARAQRQEVEQKEQQRQRRRQPDERSPRCHQQRRVVQAPKGPDGTWPVSAAAVVLPHQGMGQQQEQQQRAGLEQRGAWPAPRRSGQGSALLSSPLAAPLPWQQQWYRTRLELDSQTLELLRRFGDELNASSEEPPSSLHSTSTANTNSQCALLAGTHTAAETTASPDRSLEVPGAPAGSEGIAAAAAGVAGGPQLSSSSHHRQQQCHQQQEQHTGSPLQLAQVGAMPRPPDFLWRAGAELTAERVPQAQQQPAAPCTPSPQPAPQPSLPLQPSLDSCVGLGSTCSLPPPGSITVQDSVALPVLPWSDWALQPEEIEVCRRPDGSWWELGSGAFGTVYKGLYHGLQPVAVKVLHSDTDPRVLQEFVKEITLLKNFRDRNIVQFLGASLDGPVAMLVTEFMELGDLWRALPLKNQAGERIFCWGRRGWRVALDVARGLHYLHHKRVVHLDLKSANILLSRHGTAKICDCGFSRVLTREFVSSGAGTTGTFAWSAPEVLAGRRCTEKADIFSYGVVLWEICTGDVPVRGSMRTLQPPQDCPQEVVDLYERCMAEDPLLRPTAAELVRTISALL